MRFRVASVKNNSGEVLISKIRGSLINSARQTGKSRSLPKRSRRDIKKMPHFDSAQCDIF